MSSQKNSTKKVVVSLLVILILGLATSNIIFYKNYKKASENYTLNEQKINILDVKMDSLSQKSMADELFINGYYDSALIAYGKISAGNHNDSFISNRKKIIEQMRDFRLSLRMQADSAQSQSEFRQSLLQMKTIALENEFAEKTDSLYKSMKGRIDNLQKELNKKDEKLANSSYIRRLTFYNTKGTSIKYFGEVANGRANGEGIGIHSTGSIYDGEWRNNQKHGKGTYKWIEGEVYEGEFKNDKISGTGTYYWVNGDKYVGEWDNNQRNGEGTLYNKDNKIVFKGIWKNDEFIQAVN